LVEGTPEREGTVSSTKVREAARQHDHDTVAKLVTEGVKRHILDNRLYVDEDA
jgi:nicotinic acid mononucleotide adenylyltransferase